MTLKECPFCHKTERIEQGHDCGELFVECLNCGAHGPIAETEDEATDKWNGRNDT